MLKNLDIRIRFHTFVFSTEKNRMFKKVLSIALLGFALEASAQQTYYPTLRVDSNEAGQLIRNLRYEEAQTLLKKEITQAKKKKQSTAVFDRQQKEAATGLQMLKGTAQIVVIDSVIVPKTQLLNAYHFSPEVGKIWLEDSKLGKQSVAIYETERGNRRYRAEVHGDSTLSVRLVSIDKEGERMSRSRELKGLGITGDSNYPFMMSDGITFYFAAKSGEGLGHYDLYVTRYDTDNDRFYKAENMGFPYNSYANDYLLVIDEVNNIGWFASDRYQPKDKVCVYTFIPATSRHTIDYEHTDGSALRKQASLRPLKSTWTEDNASQRSAAKRRLAQVKKLGKEEKQSDFSLVVNDQKTYTSLSDFKSAEAKQLCQQWLQKQKNLDTLQQQLEGLRDEYAKANRTRQRAMSQQILDLEKRVEELDAEVAVAEKATRNAELSTKN